MTEDEARTKWCPFSRSWIVPAQLDGTPVSVNRVTIRGKAGFIEETRCLASDCMAWRWDADATDSEAHLISGYCGLAGKPEPMTD